MKERITCREMCADCPFSNNAMRGFLGGYTKKDFIGFKNSESLFPCHKTMTQENQTTADCQDMILEGKMKLCKGYAEMLIKSCHMPKYNEHLIKELEILKKRGVSNKSMDMFKFIKHHRL